MSEEQQPAATDAPESAAPRWQGKLILGLAVVVVLSVGWRVVRGGREEQTTTTTGTPDGASSLTGVAQQQTGTGEAKEPDEVDRILPYVTEGGIAMILGLFLGMATRSFLKLGVFLGVAAFLALQYLHYKGILTVNWAPLKDFVLNVTRNADLPTIIKEKLPSGGAFGVGYFLGLKRS